MRRAEDVVHVRRNAAAMLVGADATESNKSRKRRAEQSPSSAQEQEFATNEESVYANVAKQIVTNFSQPTHTLDNLQERVEAAIFRMAFNTRELEFMEHLRLFGKKFSGGVGLAEADFWVDGVVGTDALVSLVFQRLRAQNLLDDARQFIEAKGSVDSGSRLISGDIGKSESKSGVLDQAPIGFSLQELTDDPLADNAVDYDKWLDLTARISFEIVRDMIAVVKKDGATQDAFNKQLQGFNGAFASMPDQNNIQNKLTLLETRELGEKVVRKLLITYFQGATDMHNALDSDGKLRLGEIERRNNEKDWAFNLTELFKVVLQGNADEITKQLSAPLQTQANTQIIQQLLNPAGVAASSTTTTTMDDDPAPTTFIVPDTERTQEYQVRQELEAIRDTQYSQFNELKEMIAALRDEIPKTPEPASSSNNMPDDNNIANIEELGRKLEAVQKALVALEAKSATLTPM